MRSFIKRKGVLPFLLPTGMAIGSIIYLIESFKLNFGSRSIPEEGFLPIIIGFLLFVGSCLLMAEVFIKDKKDTDALSPMNKAETINFILLTGILLGYVVLLPILGFCLTSFVTLISSARLMQARWRSALIFGVSITLICYILFILWLQIPFPSFVLMNVFNK